MAHDKAPSGHSEFGGGPGMVDPERRRSRALEPHEELWEVYATDPSAPADSPAADPILAPIERP